MTIHHIQLVKQRHIAGEETQPRLPARQLMLLCQAMQA